MQNVKYTAETYIKLYGESAIDKCKNMIEIALTGKAQTYWKKVLHHIETS